MFVLLGNNHLSRKSRVPVLDTYQPPRIHSNHIYSDELHQKPRALVSNEEKAEKVNSDLEKMIQFMTILGQVDRYLSSRAKSFVSTLGRAIDNSADDQNLYNDRDNMPAYEY